MNLEARARAAAEGLRTATPADADAALDQLRRTSLRRSATRVAGVGVAAALVWILASGALVHDRDTAEPAPAQPPSSTSPPPTAEEPINTESWTTYKSSQYGVKVGHPPNWSEIPARRAWEFDTDAAGPPGRAAETFLSAAGSVAVSAWNVPLDAGTSIESIADLEAWVTQYCQASDSEPCSDIDDRAVELCLEKWDCHPGLLVPFNYDVQAFFTGGIPSAGVAENPTAA